MFKMKHLSEKDDDCDKNYVAYQVSDNWGLFYRDIVLDGIS